MAPGCFGCDDSSAEYVRLLSLCLDEEMARRTADGHLGSFAASHVSTIIVQGCRKRKYKMVVHCRRVSKDFVKTNQKLLFPVHGPGRLFTTHRTFLLVYIDCALLGQCDAELNPCLLLRKGQSASMVTKRFVIALKDFWFLCFVFCVFVF